MQGILPSTSPVCIVGGGPAGLAAAIALHQRGRSAVVLDHAVPPIEKACGEGLLPDSLLALHSLGIQIPPEAGFRFRGIRFTDGHSTVTADFPQGPALGLRRTVLHNLLVGHAQQIGINLFWGVKRVQLFPPGISADGTVIKTDFVIAADGQNSSLRRAAGLEETARPISHRYGFRRHYRLAPGSTYWSPYMELHWGHKSQIYITPVAHDEVAVALISRDSTLRLERALNDFPEVRSRLKGATPITSERGALSISRTLRRVAKPGLALLGDASGSVDALTGEGIGLAFRQSLALAHSLSNGDLSTYEAQHRQLSRKPRLMAALMLLLDRHPNLQKRALAGLAARPSLFQSLLAIHVGEGAFADLFSWEALAFCRKFLTA